MQTCRIFLWGQMGSGKTFLGRQLADDLHLPFYDLDHLIEAEQGQSISQLFETLGESAFRDLEKEHLWSLIVQYPRFLLATGGGTPCFFDNAQRMNQAGLCIYLKTPIERLARRLQLQQDTRPIIRNQTLDQLIHTLESQLQQRQPYYEQATLEYSVPEEADQALLELSAYLQRFLRK